MSKILKFETLGIFFISVIGSLLHFTFAWFNKYWFVGAFSAVNESTWEHLKLAVIPAIVWAVLENRVLREKANNFLFAKVVGIYLMPISIVALFYSYKALLGYNFLAIDISIFVLSVVIGQLVSYKIMTMPEFLNKLMKNLFFMLLAILLMGFVLFTFFPPHCFIFQDPISGGYGIIN